MINAKYPPKVLAACLGLVGFSGGAGAQELFGVHSDYHQQFGLELLQDSILLSDGFEHLKVGVRASAEYDSNIFLQESGGESDVIFSTDLILGLESKRSVQNRWALSYITTFKTYVDNSSLDGVDGNLFGSYGRALSRTQIDLSGSVSDTSGSDRFANGHTDKLLTAANLDVTRIISGKSRVDFDLSYRGSDYDDDTVFSDRYVYDTRLTWQYQWTGKTTVGPYVGYEYVSVKRGSDERAWSTGVTANYQAFAKTAFTGSIGVEDRSFSGDAIDNRSNGTFNLGATHRYSPKTSFALNAYRRTQASVGTFGNGFDSTGLSLDANYLASNRLILRARTNYEHADYFAVNTGAASASDTDYYSVSLGGQYRAPYGIVLGTDATWRTQAADDSSDEFDGFSLQLNASYYF